MSATTPAEACRKLCPFKLAGPMSGDGMLCDADQCMGWVWTQHETEVAKTPAGSRPVGLGWTKRPHIDGGVVWVRRRSDSDRLGTCGACNRTVIPSLAPGPIQVLAPTDVEPA